MKLLLENWRKLLEGEVIQFPHRPKISEDNLQYVIQLENAISQKLANMHHNMASIPVEKIEKLEQIMNDIEELLKK
jgi:argonaute-like protein implicated in RNA metabolism and viral defense